ncbi:MAG: nucleotide-binding protein, PIN domain-containing protein [Desulfobacterales bacterium]|nr:nucleotide-binding protein, PIN domain-containing protein [Desulfobacterales bacterium]
MRDTFFDSDNNFFAPNYIIGELFEKKEKILRFSALSEAELYELFYRILNKIEFINEHFVSSDNKYQAFKICKDIDEDDIPFIALSLQLNALFWTGDKRLKNHLKEQGINLFFDPKY